MSNATTDLDAPRRLRALGHAIRRARGAMSQEELGNQLGGVPQGTISRWERGQVDLGVEELRRLELTLGLPHGDLMRAAGYSAGGQPPAGDPIRILQVRSTDDLLGLILAAVELDLGARIVNSWAAGLSAGTTEVVWDLELFAEAPGAEE